MSPIINLVFWSCGWRDRYSKQNFTIIERKPTGSKYLTLTTKNTSTYRPCRRWTVTMQVKWQEIRFGKPHKNWQKTTLSHETSLQKTSKLDIGWRRRYLSHLYYAQLQLVDFFQDDEDEYPVIYAVRLNDDDYDEYIDEDDEVGYYDLTSDEQRKFWVHASRSRWRWFDRIASTWWILDWTRANLAAEAAHEKRTKTRCA